MKQFFRYIFIGTLSFVPLFIVVQLMLWLNTLSTDLFYFVSIYTKNSLYTASIFVFIILLIAFIGYSIEKAGKSLVVSLIDKLLAKVPAISNIYAIVKKITALFTPNNKDTKKEVVLVEYPKDDCWVPAYVLNKFDNILVLFVPTSPNPTSGYTVIIEEHRVKKTTLTIAEASQFIISMGVDFVKEEEISKIIQQNKKV